MKYQVGRAGRVVVARFEDKEDVLSNLTDIAKKENIKAAVVYLVGGMREGKIVVGPGERCHASCSNVEGTRRKP